MTRLTAALLLTLLTACGEDKQDTDATDDTAACEVDVETISVCECGLSLDWGSASYAVTSVDVVGVDLTALEIQEALCNDSVAQANIAFTNTLSPEDGATEILVDALNAPAMVNLLNSEEVVATVVLDPDAAESTSTVVFE